MVDGTVFVGSDDDRVYALDRATGDQQWTFKTERMVFSSPTVVDGTAFVGSGDGRVYALDATVGDEQWRFKPGFAVTSSPTVADDIVFVGSHDGNVYAGCRDRRRTLAVRNWLGWEVVTDSSGRHRLHRK